MTDIFALLAAPFPPAAVSWRVGTSNKKKVQRDTNNNQAKATKGQVLAYLDARDVMDRLDAVCGPGGWQNRYSHTDKKTVCEIGILSDGQWVWKADGAGDSDIEAEKGALSDAFKRAAVRWGIGRYLYHLPTPWVDLDEWERIPDSEMKKLHALLSRDAAKPPEREAPKAVPTPRADAPKPTIAERAKALETALRGAATDPAKMKRIYEMNAGLCADLDRTDPERLDEITKLYERLQETPEEIFA